MELNGKNVYFISDLHLGASYIGNSSEHEKRVCHFLRSIKNDAARLYLVGDVLDYWFEYKNVVPRGFIRFFGSLAELADAGVEIVWLTGNHDIWLFNYLRDEIGLTVVDGNIETEIAGKRFFIAHGDAVPPLKNSFRFIRWLFRNRTLQKLYSGIHPRWTIPFAHRWSSHSRKAGGYTTQSGATPEDDPYVVFARKFNTQHQGAPINFFIFGHRHEVFEFTDKKNFNATTIILGDWITKSTYGIFNGECFKLRDFSSKMQP